MKVDQLFEKKPEATDWVKKVDADYKHMLRSLGFTDTTKPTVKKDTARQVVDSTSWWRFGGCMRPTGGDELLTKDDRLKMGVKAMPAELAKFLLKMAQTGRVVRVIEGWAVKWRESQHIIRPDDNPAEVERLVRAGFRENAKRQTGSMDKGYATTIEPYFQWEMEPPKDLAPEEPQPQRRLIRVVKKATA